ncbi:hypothetical protein [Ideonella sp. YS5]|uniref:hypothetical protein n=1 Tax=Ideonella sp. YS5 TaxID=3453714 RepID=UPI003EED34F8
MSLIPAYAPDWTDHNPSDPGITLIELLAYYSEVLSYRSLRITPDARLAFLRLLSEPVWSGWAALQGGAVTDVDDAIGERVKQLAQIGCASTAKGMEDLALACARHDASASRCKTYVRGLQGRELRHLPGGPGHDPRAAGDIGLIVATLPPLPQGELLAFCDQVHDALKPHCLLTARVHVHPCTVVGVRLAGKIVLRPGVRWKDVAKGIDDELARRFGVERSESGSPFGGAVHLADIIGLIDNHDGVDYVESLFIDRIAAGRDPNLDAPAARLGVRLGVHATLGVDARFGGDAGPPAKRFEFGADGEAEAVRLQAWEVADVKLSPQRIVAVEGDDVES